MPCAGVRVDGILKPHFDCVEWKAQGNVCGPSHRPCHIVGYWVGGAAAAGYHGCGCRRGEGEEAGW